MKLPTKPRSTTVRRMNDPNNAERDKELVRVPFAITRQQKRVYLWALRHRQGMDMGAFFMAGADEQLRAIVAERVARGGNVRQDVAEYLQTVSKRENQ